MGNDTQFVGTFVKDFTEDVKDTRAYREFKEEGREEGELLGSLKTLDDLLAKGLLAEKTYQELAQPLRAKLDALRGGSKG